MGLVLMGGFILSKSLIQFSVDDLVLNAPDNHNVVITHLEPDILECEVKWALGSITLNKASGSDEIPVELFQTQKMLL